MKINTITYILKGIWRSSLLKVSSGVVLLYSSYQGIINFMRGYHNLDLAFNFLNLGYTQDTSLTFKIVDLKEAYIIGLNQMLNGLGWVVFALIFAFLFGYLIRRAEK